MINGVLIERTVADVIPTLKTNSEGLGKVLEDLVKSYKKQQDDMEKWKKVGHSFELHRKHSSLDTADQPLQKNNIQVVQN